MRRFKLMDGVALSKMYPDTFEVPSFVELAKVEVGDFVKLGFKIQQKDAPSAERMWVKVAAFKGNQYVGTIANNPMFLKAEYGDIVLFEPRHILTTQAK